MENKEKLNEEEEEENMQRKYVVMISNKNVSKCKEKE